MTRFTRNIVKDGFIDNQSINLYCVKVNDTSYVIQLTLLNLYISVGVLHTRGEHFHHASFHYEIYYTNIDSCNYWNMYNVDFVYY